MHKNSIFAFLIAGLLVVTGIIYAVSAYEEPIEAAAESADEATSTNSGSDSVASTNASSQGMDPATMVQTSFFAVAALANIGVAVWIIVAKARTGKMRIPMIIAAVGSAFLIALYIASRMISLPVVGIQDDIGAIDIASKVIQGVVVALSVLIIVKGQKVSPSLASPR